MQIVLDVTMGPSLTVYENEYMHTSYSRIMDHMKYEGYDADNDNFMISYSDKRRSIAVVDIVVGFTLPHGQPYCLFDRSWPYCIDSESLDNTAKAAFAMVTRSEDYKMINGKDLMG